MARKKRGFFSKILFFFNSLFAVMLLLAYLLPYIPPKTFPFLSVLSLGMPLLIFVNALFLVYWVIRLKRELLLSLIILAIGFNHVLSLYKFTAEKEDIHKNDISLMSYNVRQFNRYQWIKDDKVTQKIENFISEESPDILCLQEYYAKENLNFPEFKYKFVKLKMKKSGQVIFSELPILKTGSLDFPNTPNNAIYADILIQNDTVRIFNIHLESLKIDPTLGTFEAERGKRFFKRVGSSFQKQQDQIKLILTAVKQSPYKTIICGDMNNSAFSYVYRKLSGGFQDAFKEAGTGFGRTFNLNFIPLRIDVFLVDKHFQVDNFKNYEIQLSDHYPISTRVRIKNK